MFHFIGNRMPVLAQGGLIEKGISLFLGEACLTSPKILTEEKCLGLSLASLRV